MQYCNNFPCILVQFSAKNLKKSVDPKINYKYLGKHIEKNNFFEQVSTSFDILRYFVQTKRFQVAITKIFWCILFKWIPKIAFLNLRYFSSSKVYVKFLSEKKLKTINRNILIKLSILNSKLFWWRNNRGKGFKNFKLFCLNYSFGNFQAIPNTLRKKFVLQLVGKSQVSMNL